MADLAGELSHIRHSLSNSTFRILRCMRLGHRDLFYSRINRPNCHSSFISLGGLSVSLAGGGGFRSQRYPEPSASGVGRNLRWPALSAARLRRRKCADVNGQQAGEMDRACRSGAQVRT